MPEAGLQQVNASIFNHSVAKSSSNAGGGQSRAHRGRGLELRTCSTTRDTKFAYDAPMYVMQAKQAAKAPVKAVQKAAPAKVPEPAAPLKQVSRCIAAEWALSTWQMTKGSAEAV